MRKIMDERHHEDTQSASLLKDANCGQCQLLTTSIADNVNCGQLLPQLYSQFGKDLYFQLKWLEPRGPSPDAEVVLYNIIWDSASRLGPLVAAIYNGFESSQEDDRNLKMPPSVTLSL